MTPAVASGYHEIRFTYDRRRAAVWRALCAYLQQWVRQDAGLLELGAGYGEFSSSIRAARKWALDVNPDLVRHWHAGVTPLIQSALERIPLADESVATVFASNFFEHFTQEDGAAILAEAWRILAPGGRLIVVQPNFRLQPRRYFDDYTHKTIYTDAGFQDFLGSLGWRVAHCEPRFTPFTMKSPLPASGWLVKLYLALPYRPLAGQFLVVAEKEPG
jgi:ubiquinone/menaquinone biosynthesis C-methylase UbiE